AWKEIWRAGWRRKRAFGEALGRQIKRGPGPEGPYPFALSGCYGGARCGCEGSSVTHNNVSWKAGLMRAGRTVQYCRHCDKGNMAKDKAGETPYYPLQVGNTWNYRAGENRYSMRVAKHEKVGDAMTAKIEMLVEGKARSEENIGVTGDGIYRYSYEGKEAKP